MTPREPPIMKPLVLVARRTGSLRVRPGRNHDALPWRSKRPATSKCEHRPTPALQRHTNRPRWRLRLSCRKRLITTGVGDGLLLTRTARFRAITDRAPITIKIRSPSPALRAVQFPRAWPRCVRAAGETA